MDTPPLGCTISNQVCSIRRAGHFRRRGRSVLPQARAAERGAARQAQGRAGDDAVGKAREPRVYMSDEHHNRWSERDLSRGQLIGGSRCGVRVGGDLGRWPSSRTRLGAGRGLLRSPLLQNCMWPFSIMQLFDLMAHVMCTMHCIMTVMEGGGG